MEKATTTLLVVLAIGALIGAAGGYYYMQPTVKDAFDQGVAYQQNIQTQTVTTAPDLTVEWDGSDFDMTGEVDADGNVAADTDGNYGGDILITNNGDTDATGVWISLYNPVKNIYGIDSDFETENTKVYIDVGAISKISLYKDGAYLDGYMIGTIPAGSEVSISFYFELLENNDGDYPFGANTDMSVYIYGAGAPSVETLDFTVIT
jgi:hypothetical protein